jgi:hypothetical protein
MPCPECRLVRHDTVRASALPVACMAMSSPASGHRHPESAVPQDESYGSSPQFRKAGLATGARQLDTSARPSPRRPMAGERVVGALARANLMASLRTSVVMALANRECRRETRSFFMRKFGTRSLSCSAFALYILLN